MISNTAKIALALAIGLATATSAAYAGPAQTHMDNGAQPAQDNVFRDMANTSVHLARETWHGSERVADTVVHSPVIAFQAIRGERPLVSHETAAQNTGHREQIALTGHRKDTPSKTDKSVPRHYDPPI